MDRYSARLIAALLVLAGLALPVSVADAANRGVPFIRSFSAREYNAHNRNYDVATDGHGTVFVANLDGLLYYDGSSWRRIQTPGISRVTRIAIGRNGRIWVGGFNVFGYLEPDWRGCLRLVTIMSDKEQESLGEVDMIKVEGESVYVHTSDGAGYRVQDGKTLRRIHDRVAGDMVAGKDSVVSIRIGDEVYTALPMKGLEVRHGGKRRLLTEMDGLGSTAINFVTYDNCKTLWGATEHGVFAMEVPSPFSRITETQGLKGEVYSVCMIDNTVYFGTLQGMYRLSEGVLTQLRGMTFACWQMLSLSDGELLAATADGLYRVTNRGLTRLTDGNTLCVCRGDDGTLYTGETDGLYEVSANKERRKIAPVEKCTAMRITGSRLRAETIYGELWEVTLGEEVKVEKMPRNVQEKDPKIDFTDMSGRRWVTDFEGRNLRVVQADGNEDKVLSAWVKVIADRTINAIYVNEDKSLWVGGDFGAVNCDLSMIGHGSIKMQKDPVYIRQVVAYNDSVIWGGYSRNGVMPKREVTGINLSSSCHSITVYFSAASMSVFHPTKYRYRLNGGRWSPWSEETSVRFSNMQYGHVRMEVQGLDLFGNVSDTAAVEWYLGYPLYMKWWAILLYVLVVGLVARYIVLYRMKKLQRAKQKLERTVSERTAELTSALDDLQRMQGDLVRMERTATAGKLTQGLIDRILNPINYINNFSKLTSGLARELHEDIRNERENMSTDNYEDCEDILSMMQTNLAKIEEHGVNTTRTLRAMEAMLKNQIGNVASIDMGPLCRQAVQVTAEYHKKDIEQYGISLRCELPDSPLCHDVDAEAMNRVLLAMLANSIYAVVKKCQREPYSPEVVLTLAGTPGGHVSITVHDNGIGIEEGIVDKVFDPFFTTKPTGEAAGVGLYLAKETVQDHGGTIAVRTGKDEYTDFIISL